ncbi:MAG: thioredoxin domain-containing protein [Nitrospirota bacterium]|nr:thioredoxin domain-containing protein [Nitrospirota bacterium]
MNRLANERSPYLKHAADQPIDWYPWCDEAFERARAENKPVFLSSGGVWCHWCHVMAQETFSDGEVARVLNEQFISIKLDRDERPDIDRRYQQAIALMGSAGGWPLSVFLTPDRTPFFGGTYFPPEDRFGRPGFRKVLASVRDFYGSRSLEAAAYGIRVMEALAPEQLTPGDLERGALDRAEKAMLEHFDPVNGGFGKAPKFPLPGVLEFLIRRAASGSVQAAEAVRSTLDAMAAGGFHDQLAGGFHRYSVDEGWHVPHFEKMADDNAWLLRNYLDAYGLFGDERYREVAEDIIRFVREELSDPDGGFFASQDADVTPDDEGGYFTWTDEEFKGLLTIDEYQVLTLRFLHERGTLHHDPDKRVLREALTESAVASELRMQPARVHELLEQGTRKLLAARKERKAPFVDRTLYTSLNSMFISSFLKAYRVLGRADLRDFALLSLERILRERVIDSSVLHVEGVAGLLDDYIHLIDALVSAYEATADVRCLELARELMDRCIRRFGDQAGGFNDTDGGVLGTRLMRIEDIPHPSANGTAIPVLLKLYHLTDRKEYLSAAESSLRIFAPSATELGVHGGTYYAGLEAWFSMVKFTVEAAPESDLARAALRVCGPATVIIYGEDNGRVIPCIGDTCLAPVITEAELPRSIHGSSVMKQLGRSR